MEILIIDNKAEDEIYSPICNSEINIMEDEADVHRGISYNRTTAYIKNIGGEVEIKNVEKLDRNELHMYLERKYNDIYDERVSLKRDISFTTYIIENDINDNSIFNIACLYNSCLSSISSNESDMDNIEKLSKVYTIRFDYFHKAYIDINSKKNIDFLDIDIGQILLRKRRLYNIDKLLDI